MSEWNHKMKVDERLPLALTLPLPNHQSKNSNFATLFNKGEPWGTIPLLVESGVKLLRRNFFLMKWNHFGGGSGELQKNFTI